MSLLSDGPTTIAMTTTSTHSIVVTTNPLSVMATPLDKIGNKIQFTVCNN